MNSPIVYSNDKQNIERNPYRERGIVRTVDNKLISADKLHEFRDFGAFYKLAYYPVGNSYLDIYRSAQ